MVASAGPQPELAALTDGRRLRLKIIVTIGLAIVLTFVVTIVYAEHRVNDENERVQRVARSVTITEQDILEDAYGHSDKVSAAFGVAGDRIAMSIDAGETCIAVRSDYFTSSRTSAFVVRDGSLTPTEHC
jgi:hypothetical protein